MPTIDYEELQRQLVTATQHALRYICELTHDEQLYAFGLYVSHEMNYISPTANTEEGLLECAQRYRQIGGKPIEQLTHDLRWISADWKFHLTGTDFFTSIEEILLTGWSENFSFYDGDPTIIHTICMHTLHTCRPILEDHGLQNTVLLNVFSGDTNISNLISQATELNSIDLVRKYKEDLDSV